MKLTVLVDNNTLIDHYFLAEPGVSYYIEIEEKKVLFDTGYSDVFMKNAAKMGIDLLDTDTVVLSHAHLDHTWGLQHLIQAYAERQFENRPTKRPTLIAHPSVFDRRFIPGLGNIGCLISEETASQYFDLQLTRQPQWLHPNLVFLGEIERENDFEACYPIGRIRHDDTETDDFLLDDSSLAYKSSQGLVIVAGCAHAGICNTVTQAMRVCDDSRLVDIIGGFHLLEPTERQLRNTVEHMAKWRPLALHACHCTDLKSRLALSKVADLQEVGVGLELIYEG
ncbi:MAG: MBL fold metallo-hydrolase [Desulfosarcina sp.]|nr:MBL fold metallo-hydrolase [Desulfosarcina sp.]MBC2744973.1 MBL fold metallo-hydrolase [Desulfosarcina sp.]MBC2767881.1 MBL fold metallo-hydrolase [Desulfosarcina sp.]